MSFKHRYPFVDEKQYPVNEVLQHVVAEGDIRKFKSIRIDFDGDKINVNSLRLQTFKVKGISCCKCGLEATFFRKEKNIKTDPYHFNLYGFQDGREMQFTKDHIIPKAKGGKDVIENMQTMCKVCNEAKGTNIE